MMSVQDEYKFYGIKFEEYVPNIDTKKCLFVPNFWLKQRKAEKLTGYVAYPKNESTSSIKLRIRKRSEIPKIRRKHYAAKVIFGVDSFEAAELECKKYNESGMTDTDDRLVSSLKIKTQHPQNIRSKATKNIKEATLKTATKRSAQPDIDIETKRSKVDNTAKKFQKTCRLLQDTPIGRSNDVSFNKQNVTPKDMAGTSQSSFIYSPNLVNQSFNPRNSSEAESREQAFCNTLYVQFSDLQEKFVNMRLMFNNLRATYIQSLEEVKTLVNSIHDLRNNISASTALKDMTAAAEVQKTLTEGEQHNQDVNIEVIDNDDNQDEASDKERDQTRSTSYKVPPEHALSNNIATKKPKNATAAAKVQKILTEGEQNILDVNIDVIDDDKNEDEASEKEREQTRTFPFVTPPEHVQRNNISASPTPKDVTTAADIQKTLTEGKQNNQALNILVTDNDDNNDEALDKERDQICTSPFSVYREHERRNNMSTSPIPKDVKAEAIAIAIAIVQQTLPEKEQNRKELNEVFDDVGEATDNERDPNDSLKYPEYTSAPGLVALRSHNDAYPVYLKETELDLCKMTAENCASLTGMLLNEIFTETALQVESVTGSGLDERALDEVRKYVTEYADLKGWYKLDENNQKRYY